MATRGIKEEKQSAAKDDDYEGDEFEKDDIVTMVEPKKPTISSNL